MMKTNSIPALLKITRSLYCLNAVVWMAFGGLSLARAYGGESLARWTITALMFVNVLVMLWLGVRIIHGTRGLISFAIFYQVLNVLLSVMDQFGWIDALILLLNLVLLGLLVAMRFKWIGRAQTVPGES